MKEMFFTEPVIFSSGNGSKISSPHAPSFSVVTSVWSALALKYIERGFTTSYSAVVEVILTPAYCGSALVTKPSIGVQRLAYLTVISCSYIQNRVIEGKLGFVFETFDGIRQNLVFIIIFSSLVEGRA